MTCGGRLRSPNRASAAEPPMPMFRGRCVGGTTTINTKVALRPSEEDYEKWHAAAGLVNEHGDPFGESDLLPTSSASSGASASASAATGSRASTPSSVAFKLSVPSSSR